MGDNEWGCAFEAHRGNLCVLEGPLSFSLTGPFLCDPKLVENCVCLLRNLSYQVHREIPQAERYQEAPPSVANSTGPHAASCFGAKKGKGEACFPLPRSFVQDGERKLSGCACGTRAEQCWSLPSRGCPLCRVLHAGAGGGGVRIDSWAVKAESQLTRGLLPLLVCFLCLSFPLCFPACFPVILLTTLSCVFLPSFLSSPFHLG